MKDIKMGTFKKEKEKFRVKEGEKHLWSVFHPHHYMTANKPIKESLPLGSKFFTFYWVIDGKEILVGCAGLLFQISPKQDSKRLTRVVVLPEYQGLGFGAKIINTIAELYTDMGFKVYSATFHPRLGEYRESSELWEPTLHNQQEYKAKATAGQKCMSGLRDGIKMYRHSFVKPKNYKLLYDPVKFNKLQKEYFDLGNELTKDNEPYYLELFNLLKPYYNINNEVLVRKQLPELSTETDEHRQSKIEHQRIFKKNKRKVLTKEERMKLKERKKDGTKN